MTTSLVVDKVQSGQGLQMADPVGLDPGDFVDIQIEFRCFWWDSSGNFGQFSSRTSDNCSCTRTFRRTVVFTQTTLIVVT
jgi:hypothetical protein